MTRLVQIFDRPCCGPSAASQLADFLRERVGADVTVEYHDLAAGGSQQVRVPGALVGHLSGGGALPVLAVDGALVAAGTLPNLMDALDLAHGQPSRTVLTATATATATATGDQCAPGCC